MLDINDTPSIRTVTSRARPLCRGAHKVESKDRLAAREEALGILRSLGKQSNSKRKINVSTIGEWQNFCPFFRRTRRDAWGWLEELSPDDPDFEETRAFLEEVQSGAFDINQYIADRLASSDDVPAAQWAQCWQPPAPGSPSLLQTK